MTPRKPSPKQTVLAGPSAPNVLTMIEAAARLGITRAGVSIAVRKGLMRARRVGAIVLIDVAEVERYRRERRPAHRPRLTPRPPEKKSRPTQNK